LNLFQPILAPPQLFRKLIASPIHSLLLIFAFVHHLRPSQQFRDLYL
jgi:hypothetical protein